MILCAIILFIREKKSKTMAMYRKLPRVMLSATSSASGKTTIMCALLRALKRKEAIFGKMDVRAFKCGPDFIDPMFHRSALGVESGNLDTFFLSAEENRALFSHYTNENCLSVIEGAMGYFDGVNFRSEKASSADIARALDCPVVLVVNAEGMARSILPLVKGFLDADRAKKIKGIILNRVKSSTAAELKSIIEVEAGIKVLGFLETVPDCAIDSRHLGLMTPECVENLNEKIEKLADSLEKSVDIDEIIKIASDAPLLEVPKEPPAAFFPIYQNENVIPVLDTGISKPKIAIAKDEAFCFYYRENLDLLRASGAKIIEFSPLADSALPDCDALYLGGGYPEVFSQKLADNVSMMTSIRNRVRAGLPTLSECGGFLYLQLLGVLEGEFHNTGSLCRFGYIEITANQDTLLLKKGEKIKAHEFHYFDTTKNGETCTAEKISGRKWSCIVSNPFDTTPALPPFTQTLNVFAGFPHLFFPSKPEIASRFVEIARKYSVEKSKLHTKCSVCPKHRQKKEANE